MQKIISYLKKNPHLIILLLILIIGFWFRSYQLLERYTYAHDADLFSWIVKDIAIDHHLRLIGQLTSADGIYIGPIFYYLLIPFFFLTGMDPAGGTILITILAMLNLVSIYFVFSRLFSRTVGLITTFLWAVLIPIVEYDRWVVPSTPSNLWSVWYFYVLIMVARGQYQVLPLLAVLIGLIWNIHIALAPALLGIPIAMLIAKKWPTIRQTITFFVVLLISNAPLIIFETKHHFSQTQAFIANLSINHGGGTGLYKFGVISTKLANNFNTSLLFPQTLHPFEIVALLVFLILPLFLLWKKILTKRDYLPLLAWTIGVYLFFSLSSTLISEYYLFNLNIIYIAFLSLSLVALYNSNKRWRKIILILLALLLVKNIYAFVTEPVYQKGYLARKAVAQYITDDSRKKGYPCVSLNYITSLGENVGFRYFFYRDNLKLNRPNSGSPIYNIVIPKEYSENELTYSYGEIGVIVPKVVPPPNVIAENCTGENANLTDPVLGFSTQ